MKQVWIIAGCVLLAGGCNRQPPVSPAPVPCRVNLTRLAVAHPRWPELQALDARIGRLQAVLRAPLLAPRRATFPRQLPVIPSPPPTREHPAPQTLADLAAVSQDIIRTQQAQWEQRQNQRLQNERLREQVELSAETRLFQAKAENDRWTAADAVIRRYQPDITRLRLLNARLRDPAPIPESRQHQGKQLAAGEQELQALEQRRDSELETIDHRIEQQLAEQVAQRRRESAERTRALEEELRRQRETTLLTAQQDWDERLETARQSLTEAPPAPAIPPFTRAAAPGIPLPATGAGSGAVTHGAERTLADLRVRRVRLEEVLRAEVRLRVLAAARRARLKPSFNAADSALPDRTDYFARVLRITGGDDKS